MNVAEFYAVYNQFKAKKRVTIAEALHFYNAMARSKWVSEASRKQARHMRRQLVSQTMRRFEKEQEAQSDEI